MNMNDNCLALALLACSQCGCQNFWRCWNELCWMRNGCGPCGCGCGPCGCGCGGPGFCGPHGKGCGGPGFCGPHGKGCGGPGFCEPHGKGCCPPGFCGPHGRGCCPPGFGGPHGGHGGKGCGLDSCFGFGGCGVKSHDCPPPKECCCKCCGCKLDAGGFGFKGLGSLFG